MTMAIFGFATLGFCYAFYSKCDDIMQAHPENKGECLRPNYYILFSSLSHTMWFLILVSAKLNRAVLDSFNWVSTLTNTKVF
ncbi:hypothetical protein AAMO2058_001331300 [Amorphochlora amoebiformis]